MYQFSTVEWIRKIDFIVKFQKATKLCEKKVVNDADEFDNVFKYLVTTSCYGMSIVNVEVAEARDARTRKVFTSIWINNAQFSTSFWKIQLYKSTDVHSKILRRCVLFPGTFALVISFSVKNCMQIRWMLFGKFSEKRTFELIFRIVVVVEEVCAGWKHNWHPHIYKVYLNWNSNLKCLKWSNNCVCDAVQCIAMQCNAI